MQTADGGRQTAENATADGGRQTAVETFRWNVSVMRGRVETLRWNVSVMAVMRCARRRPTGPSLQGGGRRVTGECKDSGAGNIQPRFAYSALLRAFLRTPLRLSAA